MNRRNALRNISGLALASAAATALPNRVLAQTAPVATPLRVGVQIENNHRHSLDLTLSEVVAGIRAGGIKGAKIQGQSRHPHTADFTQGDLIKLILDGEVTTVSSLDAGHSHELTVRMA